jgi:hypothetical protein
MAKIVHGKCIGQSAKISAGCSAVIFDESHERILLTRRADNGRWCLPGGRTEPGECVEAVMIGPTIPQNDRIENSSG